MNKGRALAALLPPLARLIARAAQRTQLIVVSHAADLVAALDEQPASRQILLEKQLSETILGDRVPRWNWPAR